MTSKGGNRLDLYPQPGEVDRQEPVSANLTPLEAASFVEGMTLELKAIARTAKLDTLAYFLDMARMEAAAQIERLNVRAPGRRDGGTNRNG